MSVLGVSEIQISSLSSIAYHDMKKKKTAPRSSTILRTTDLYHPLEPRMLRWQPNSSNSTTHGRNRLCMNRWSQEDSYMRDGNSNVSQGKTKDLAGLLLDLVKQFWWLLDEFFPCILSRLQAS